MNQIQELIDEILIEKQWELQRRFMQEVERELGIEGQCSVVTLMNSANVAWKWIEYARNN